MKNNKKLKIIFIDFDDIKNPLLSAGQAKVTYEVGMRLVKNGHSVTVISSKFPGYKDRKELGISYKHIGIGSKNIRLNNLFYIFLLPFSVRKLQGDVIVECFTAPISTLLSPLFTKIPVIGLSTSFDAQRFSDLYHLPFWIIEKYGCRLYKYFIALTPYLEKKMRIYNQKALIKIIPQGLSKKYFGVKNDKPEYILFVGRLDIGQKGLDLLLNAYKKVVGKMQFDLVIAGSGPDREKIELLISELSISERVRLVGFADEEMKMKLYSKAAFIVFPSRNEGFSLVSLEAIATGNRIVSFDIPSLDWAEEVVARKVKAFDVNAYAKALVAETVSGNKFKTYSDCQSFVRKYSWEEVTNSFENFFIEILNNLRFK